MELVTGFAGKPHIKPAQDGAFHAGIVGSGSYVFNTGEKLSAIVITNNLIRIMDGDLIANGRHITIAKGNYEEVEIANGLQGVKRNDLICARYEKNADSGIESAYLVVIQGTSTQGTPEDPEYNDNSILDGTLISDFPLYRIKLDGLNVGEPEKLFTVIKNINDIQGDINALNSNLDKKQDLILKEDYGFRDLKNWVMQFTNSDTPIRVLEYNGYGWSDCPLGSMWGTVIAYGTSKNNGYYVICVENQTQNLHWNIINNQGSWVGEWQNSNLMSGYYSGDMNNLTTMGRYWCTNCENLPTANSWGVCEVIKPVTNEMALTQIVYDQNGIYTRIYVNGEWLGWVAKLDSDHPNITGTLWGKDITTGNGQLISQGGEDVIIGNPTVNLHLQSRNNNISLDDLVVRTELPVGTIILRQNSSSSGISYGTWSCVGSIDFTVSTNGGGALKCEYYLWDRTA